jgi:hypothetical protein
VLGPRAGLCEAERALVALLGAAERRPGPLRVIAGRRARPGAGGAERPGRHAGAAGRASGGALNPLGVSLSNPERPG